MFSAIVAPEVGDDGDRPANGARIRRRVGALPAPPLGVRRLKSRFWFRSRRNRPARLRPWRREVPRPSRLGRPRGRRRSVPALEGETALMKRLAALRAAPGVDEPARRVVLHRAADRDFHIARLPPRNVRTSDQKSAVSCSIVLNAQAVSTSRKCRRPPLPRSLSHPTSGTPGRPWNNEYFRPWADGRTGDGTRQSAISTMAPQSGQNSGSIICSNE